MSGGLEPTGRPEAVATIRLHGWRRHAVRPARYVERAMRYIPPALMVVFVAWIWFPIVDLALMSVNTQPFRGIPSGDLTTEWFAALFRNEQAASALRTSVWFAAVVAIVVALMAFAVGRAFRTIRRRGALLSIILLPVLLPGLIFGFAWLVLSDQLGIQLGTETLLAVHVTWAFPFAFLAIIIASLRLRGSLLEAAADLGASPWKVLRDIELPLVRPGLIAALLFGFLLSFNELTRSIFVSGPRETLPLYVWAASSSHSSTVPLTYALTTLITVASLVCIGVAFWLLFRRSELSRLGRDT